MAVLSRSSDLGPLESDAPAIIINRGFAILARFPPNPAKSIQLSLLCNKAMRSKPMRSPLKATNKPHIDAILISFSSSEGLALPQQMADPTVHINARLIVPYTRTHKVRNL